MVAALQEWRKHHPRPQPDAVVFMRSGGEGVELRVDFREGLERAGVTRRELFERSEARSPIRLHDLRATFVTLSLASGKSETWVADRTGHRSSEMINRYRRPARTHQELGLGGLRSLAGAIPELRSAAQGGHQVGTNGGRDDRVAEGRATIAFTIARIFAGLIAEREGFEPSVPLRVHMISKLATILTIRGESRKQAQSAIRDRTRSTDATMAGGNPVAIPGALRSSNRPSRT